MFDTIAGVFKVELFRGFNGFYGIARGSLRGRGSPLDKKAYRGEGAARAMCDELCNSEYEDEKINREGLVLSRTTAIKSFFSARLST